MTVKTALRCGMSALVCATATAAAAQDSGEQKLDAAASAQADNGAIIITAQRRSQRSQDVPVSVGIVDGEALKTQNLSSLEEVSARQSSLVIRSAPGGDQIAVRGTSSGFNSGFEQSVATFVDGVYRPRNRSSRVALFDLERVEVLRGPQTTFFGANAIAGALNITTRKPGSVIGGNALAYFTPDDDEFQFEAGLDTPIGESAALRFAGRFSAMDAISRNERVDKRGEDETTQFRVSGTADLGEAVQLEARFDYAKNRNSGGNALEIVDCPADDLDPAALCARSLAELGPFDDELDRHYDASFVDEFALDLYEGVVTATVDLDFADLILTSAYQEQSVALSLEQANFPVDSVLGVSALLPARVGEEFEQFSQEVRLQSSGSGPLSYTLGVYYERGDLATDNAIGYFQGRIGALAPGFFTPNDLIVGRSMASQKSTTWSGFAAVSYDLTDALTLSAGLRYSHVKKEADREGFLGTIQPYPAGTTPPLLSAVPGPQAGQDIIAARLGYVITQFEDTDRTDSQWMPSANVTYNITPDAMIYAAYVHGFKAGGFNLQGSADIFGPEKADSYEVGAKTAWLDNRLTANVTLFRVDYSNLQEAGVLYTNSGATLSFIGNVAESRAQGVEVETSLRALDGLNLSANLAYLDSKYRSYENAPCSPYLSALAALPNSDITCPQDLSGATRANAPKWSGSVAADYSGALSDDLELQLGSTVYFRSKYFLQSLPEDITSQDGFAKVDLRAGLRGLDTNVGVAIIAQNIFDKLTSTFAGHAPLAPGSTQRIASRGRTVGIQLTAGF